MIKKLIFLIVLVVIITAIFIFNNMNNLNITFKDNIYALFINNKKIVERSSLIKVDKISKNIIKIGSGAGTGVSIVQYYNYKTKLLSKIYHTPLTENEEYIIYINIVTGKYVLIIDKIFEESDSHYRETFIDLQDNAVPSNSIIECKFTDNHNVFIKYYDNKDTIEEEYIEI